MARISQVWSMNISWALENRKSTFPCISQRDGLCAVHSALWVFLDLCCFLLSHFCFTRWLMFFGVLFFFFFTLHRSSRNPLHSKQKSSVLQWAKQYIKARGLWNCPASVWIVIPLPNNSVLNKEFQWALTNCICMDKTLDNAPDCFLFLHGTLLFIIFFVCVI